MRTSAPARRIDTSDLAEDALTDSERNAAGEALGCTAGALEKTEYGRLLEAAGLANIFFVVCPCRHLPHPGSRLPWRPLLVARLFLVWNFLERTRDWNPRPSPWQVAWITATSR